MASAAQDLAVALIVGACAMYALWALLPSALRRALATAALRLRLPAWLASPLRRATRGSSGCYCEGCDRASPARDAGSTQQVTFHPPLRR
jgi:hypothetical protein